MPTYCYRGEDGEVMERVYPMGKAPKSFVKFAVKYVRDYHAESVAVPQPSCWPMEPCYSSGVHPEQAQELRDHFKKHGLNVQVNSNGDPIYESAAQRKRALACRGLHDRASYN